MRLEFYIFVLMLNLLKAYILKPPQHCYLCETCFYYHRVSCHPREGGGLASSI